MVASGMKIERVGSISWHFMGGRCDSGQDRMPIIPCWYGWALPSWHDSHIQVADAYVLYTYICYIRGSTCAMYVEGRMSTRSNSASEMRPLPSAKRGSTYRGSSLIKKIHPIGSPLFP